MNADVVKRMERKAGIMRGIDVSEVVPHCRPIGDLSSGRVTGVEALARWDHPQRGLLSPVEFISLAEDTGMVVELGSAVLRHACRDAVGWLARLGDRAPRSVSVNLSAQIGRAHV